jgi:hypothetical protein
VTLELVIAGLFVGVGIVAAVVFGRLWLWGFLLIAAAVADAWEGRVRDTLRTIFREPGLFGLVAFTLGTSALFVCGVVIGL